MLTALPYGDYGEEQCYCKNLAILDLPHLSSPSRTMNLPFILVKLYRQIKFEMRISTMSN